MTEAAPASAPARLETRVIGGDEDERRGNLPGGTAQKPVRGRVLGTFRNTYYDFPTESDFTGDLVTLRDARCGAIAQVPRGFSDAICVQGSGILRVGAPSASRSVIVSAPRCAPGPARKSASNRLDPAKFPWGRGALGTAITPLFTVAVDDTIIPMGSAMYIPELDGLPVDAAGTATHDGCFMAQDRGLRVKGEHIDIFTGYAAMTALWNRLVPSNHGVTVVVDDPHCARAEPVVGERSAGPHRALPRRVQRRAITPAKSEKLERDGERV